MAPTPQISINLPTRNIAGSAEFYKTLCGLQEVRSEVWCSVLAADPESRFQIVLIDWVSEFVPRGARGEPQGAYLELVVDDVPAAVEAIRPFEAEIVEEPKVFGSKTRAVLRDLDGHVITVTNAEARYVLPPRQHVG